MAPDPERLLRDQRLVRRAEALDAGITDSGLRAARRDGRLVRQLRGIDLTAAAARTRDGRVRAVQAVAPHGALSGPTAARLHRWEVPDDWPNEITVAPGRHARATDPD